MSTALQWSRRCERRALVTALSLWLLAIMTAPAVSAQALTLPTVRTFGPGPEEHALHRLVHDLTQTYGADTLLIGDTATTARARRVLRRLSIMTLASVTKDMYRELLFAPTKQDALIALAGANSLADDVAPGLRLDAVEQISHDPLACMSGPIESVT